MKMSGFLQIGQKAQIKLAAYPFQKYGMLTGEVSRISADASEPKQATQQSINQNNSETGATPNISTYKARVKLDQQTLYGPQGAMLTTTPGMQVAAEINQGKRTVLEYLLSPVQKAIQESARER